MIGDLSSIRIAVLQPASLRRRFRACTRAMRLWLIAWLSRGLKKNLDDTIPVSTSARIESKDSFEDKIKRLFAGQAESLVGRLHFVNMARLREHYGSRWAKLEESVSIAVCAIIEKHLEKEHFYTRASDAFVLVFPNLDHDAAKRLCQDIVREIEESLFDDETEEPGFELQSVVMATNGQLLMAQPSPLETLNAALDRKQQARSHEEIALTATEHSPEPSSAGQSEPQANGSAAEPPIRPAVENSGPPTQTAGSETSSTRAPGYFLFRSIWHTVSKQVSSYACVPDANDTGRGRAKDPARELQCLEDFLSYVLQLMLVDRQETSLSYPLRFSTLIDPNARKRLAQIASDLDGDLKQRLIIEVIDGPSELKSMESAVLKQTLQGFGKLSIARVQLGNTSFLGLKSAGVLSVGCDLKECSLPENEILPLLNQHVEAASAAGLRTYIHGLSTLSLTTAAVCAGFDHIDGETVGELNDIPNESYPLDTKSLYNKMRKAS